MGRFLRRFKVCFIILCALAGVYLAIYAVHALVGLRNGRRENTQCTTDERVFDKAGVLSDEEEEKLRKLIARRERQTGCDIVIVTLNEPLREYARAREEYVSSDRYVMVYADDFYDEHMFGYDKPQGNGVLLLDNFNREDDGWAYTWFTTTGTAEKKYSNAMIDHLLEKSYRWSKISPYWGYVAYVNQFFHDMNGFALVNRNFSVPVILLIAFGMTLFFVWLNLGEKSGKKTTTAKSYVKNEKFNIGHREDLFIRKNVVHHRISSGSSGGGRSGGGGHHVSRGGVSHGGGGHRH